MFKKNINGSNGRVVMGDMKGELNFKESIREGKLFLYVYSFMLLFS